LFLQSSLIARIKKRPSVAALLAKAFATKKTPLRRGFLLGAFGIVIRVDRRARAQTNGELRSYI
jgi:hypothetical protein